MRNNDTDKVELLDEEVKNAAGGIKGMTKYTCVNPACSEYLIYLDYQTPNNRCPVCGQICGRVQ